MVKRVDKLTPAQTAQMGPWADKWIEIGLRTGPADRAKFEAAVARCYKAANLPWHGNVIWVPSPLVMAFAAPTADYLLGSGAVHDAVRDSVLGAVNGAVRDAVDGAVSDAVHDAVDGAVNGAVNGAVRDSVLDAVDGAVSDAVNGAVNDAVHDAVNGAVNGAVRDSVLGAVLGAVDGAVSDAVDGAVHGAVDGAVHDAVKKNWAKYIGGQFWVGGWYWGSAYVSFFREVCGLELTSDLSDRADAYRDTTQSACWWWPHKDFVMVCERPTVIHTELANPAVTRGWGSHLLHCADGPAIAWPDGWGVYSIHGVQIPLAKRHIVEAPDRITVAEIEAETNSEIRRVMIDRYGAARYVSDSGATVVHQLPADHPLPGLRTARVLRKEVPDDEPIVYVDLLNSTPEPDGTTKRYMLRVDPNAYNGDAAKNAHAAAASTWRNADQSLTYKKWKDYAPVAES
jgi:hypothetical protein